MRSLFCEVELSFGLSFEQKRNAAELLRLLIDYDLLEQAGSLALEYIEAMRDVTRGQDREVFNLKVSVL